MILKPTEYIPLCLIAQYVAASLFCGFKGAWVQGLYWAGAVALNIAVLLLARGIK